MKINKQFVGGFLFCFFIVIILTLFSLIFNFYSPHFGRLLIIFSFFLLFLIFRKQKRGFWFELPKYLFLSLLFLIIISSLKFEFMRFITDFLDPLQLWLVVVAIVFGTLTFWMNQGIIREAEEESQYQERRVTYDGIAPFLRKKWFLALFLISIFVFGLFLTTYDFKMRPMSDTGRYLFYDTPAQNIDNFNYISSHPLPEARDSFSNRYNLCYLAYTTENWDLTKCHASPVIINSLATGFTYYKIMPLLGIEQNFFNQHITFIALFYIISFLFFLVIFYFLYKYFHPLLAYIFGIFSFTAPFIIHFNRYLNYDAFLCWIGVLFTILTYLYFKYEKIKFLYYLTIVYFIGTTIKGFAVILLPIFILLYSLIYIPKKKKINPMHYLLNVGCILVGTAILYLLWPHSWVNYLDVFVQIAPALSFVGALGVFSAFVLLPYLILVLIEKNSGIKNILLKLSQVHIAFFISAFILASFIFFPTRIYETFEVFSIFHKEGFRFLYNLFFSLPQLFFSNNFIAVCLIFIGILFAIFKKSKKSSLFDFSLYFYFFYVIITSILYPSSIRYQFMVLSCFLLAGSYVLYDFISRIKFNKTKKMFFGTIALLVVLFMVIEPILFLPHLFYYKNQIASNEYFPTTGGGMLDTLDALRYINQTSNQGKINVYVNYPGALTSSFPNMTLTSHHDVDINPGTFISFDYAVFTTSGKNAMYVWPNSKKLYDIYYNETDAWVLDKIRYDSPMISVKKSVSLIEINNSLIKLQQNNDSKNECIYNDYDYISSNNTTKKAEFYNKTSSQSRTIESHNTKTSNKNISNAIMQINNTYNFDNINDAIRINDDFLEELNNFTWSFWIKTRENSPQFFMGNYQHSSHAWFFSMADTMLTFYGIADGTGINTQAKFPTIYKEWAHVAFVCNNDTNTGTVYVNGMNVTSDNTPNCSERIFDDVTSSQSAADAFIIGGRYPDDTPVLSNYFNGEIGEIEIWDEVLNETQIQTLFNNRRASIYGSSEKKAIDMDRILELFYFNGKKRVYTKYNITISKNKNLEFEIDISPEIYSFCNEEELKENLLPNYLPYLFENNSRYLFVNSKCNFISYSI